MSPSRSSPSRRRSVPAPVIDAALAFAQTLVAISVESTRTIDGIVSLPQLRVLVAVHRLGPMNLSAVAESVGLHLSNASRTCDSLVSAGLLDRSEDPADRRNRCLRLTPAGATLLGRVRQRRRELLRQLLSRLDAGQMAALTEPLTALTDGTSSVDEWSALWAC